MTTPTLPARQAPAPALGLATLFKAGPLLQDRNGDDALDFVNARLVLGEAPTPAEVAAAADVAARLGFETMAMTLPLGAGGDPGDPIVIAVGARGLQRAGFSPVATDVATLPAGHGLVTVADIGGRPAVVIAGRDDDGTRAAAAFFASRLPHVWDPQGPTLDEVKDEVQKFLAGEGVTPASVSVTSAHVASGADALERLIVAVQTSSPAELARAQGALKRLAPPRPPPAAQPAPTPPPAAPPPAQVPAAADAAGAPAVRGVRTLQVQLAAPGVPPLRIDLAGRVEPPGGPLGRRPGSGPKENLDLSSLFSNDGLLGDSDSNLIPDRVDALLSPAGEGTEGTIDLAARIGLESTGIAIPTARMPEAPGRPESEPTLVVIGTTHPLIDQLIKEKKFVRPDLQPGQGLIQVVRKAFGEKSALVVTGGDARGLARALRQLAERFPHVWQRGKDRTTIDDVEDEIRKALSGRSPAGQAATALYKLDRLAADLAGKDLESAHVKVYIDKPADGFREVVRQQAAAAIKADRLEATVESLDVQQGRPILIDGQAIDAEVPIASEVDEFWRLFRGRVVRAVKKRKPVVLEARLSEPPEIRAQIQQQARAELIKAGAAEQGTSVTILSAYKQGYSWLYDVVRPALERLRPARGGSPEPASSAQSRDAREWGWGPTNAERRGERGVAAPPSASERGHRGMGAPGLSDATARSAADAALGRGAPPPASPEEGKAIERLVIRFAEIGPPPEWKHQAMYAPTRWLLEIFPIDEVLARELKLDLKQIQFEKRPIGSPAYEVIATAPGGGEIFRQTFEPKLVLRPYFDQFPEYEKVRVTTGWLRATVDGRPVVDDRIVTDPERFWDFFQSKTLPAIYRYTMALHEGKPRADEAPHFGELRVEVTLSEPDYQVGVDQEQIASMEALHEEIYFGTLHFFDVMGRYARGPALDYPGRVIPLVRPKADGRPGTARITFTGFGASRPSVVVEYRERGGREGRVKLEVPKVALERPSALAAFVRDGRDGIERLDLRVKVDTEKDERAALVKRARAERVDETVMSAEQVRAVVANLARLRAAGLYRDALAFHDLGELRIAAGWEHDIRPESQIVAALEPNGMPRPFPDPKTLLRTAEDASAFLSAPRGPQALAQRPIVQWDTPIPPPEAYELLAKMAAAFPEATVYKVGESYLGKEIWAMDLMPPIAASHWSHAKATTMRPTVVYSARQHANEVSSTSHVLRLAELLLADPAYTPYLKKLNVVVHPITNPDGAQLAYDLYRVTPKHMLHAGYLGSLGVDVTSAQWDDDPIYPESKIRPQIWRTWLPDVFLNPHGYPSHEWVQLFSEYAGWVRNRVTESRDWWGMRGWFMPGFTYLDDPRHPRHKDAAFRIRQLITEHINGVPDVRALNERAYARYRRYGFDHDSENFKLDLTDGVLIYTALKGARANPRGGDFMVRQPQVTVWSGGTEAPDETAQGDWMTLVATAGLQWDTAILKYLAEGDHVVERKGEAFYGGVTLSMNRPRPPRPKGEKKETSQ